MKRFASRAMKWLHVATLVGFGAGMASVAGLERMTGHGNTAASAALWNRALALRLSGACLLALITSGMLLLAWRPAFLEQRWLWAKLLLTMVIAPCVWLRASPATLALASGLTLLAALLAVRRPRLGAKPTD